MKLSVHTCQGGVKDIHCFIFILTIFTSYKTVNSQCFRSLKFLTAYPASNEFSSPGYPNSYFSRASCTWRIYAHNDSHAIKLEIFNSDIEYDPFCSFDYGQVFDGSAPLYSTSLGKFCGTQTPSYVSTNSTLTLVFVSDSSKTAPGFQARYYSGLRADLIDSIESTPGSIDLAVVLGSTLGCLAFIVLLSVIFVLAYKYKQVKAKPQTRPRPRLPRPISSIQVQPYNGDDSCLINRQMPPAYEAIQGSSQSQPTGYILGNNYECSTQIDSNPTKYADEKTAIKKVAFGNSAEFNSNAMTPGIPETTASKGSDVTCNLSAGTSFMFQATNQSVLDKGKRGGNKTSFDAGPIPEKPKIQ